MPGFAPVGARRSDLVVHERSADVVTRLLQGVRVSTSPWAFIEVAAAGASVEELVMVGDSITRIGRTPRALRSMPVGVLGAAGLDVIGELVRGRRGRPGVVTAREALRLIRPGTDSPQETRLRLKLAAAGMPEPQVNPPIRLDTGQILRVDLVWPEARVAVEYDGDQHRTDKRQWREDQERDASLRAEGWTVIRVNADVFKPGDWELFVRQLRTALGG